MKKRPKTVVYYVSPTCNSRCKTCDVWRHSEEQKVNALTFDDWIRIFRSIGKVRWITFTGGEPFLIDYFKDLVIKAISIQKPLVITIPTNGLLTKKIIDDLNDILKSFKKTRIYINISLDGPEELNDKLRGVKGDFKRVIITLKELSKLKIEHPSIKIAVNTVISSYNIKNIKEFKNELVKTCKENKILLDNYIFEPAQDKKELFFSAGSVLKNEKKEDFLADKKDLEDSLRYLSKESLKDLLRCKDFLRSFLRTRYYFRMIRFLKTGKLKRCSAGRSFVEVSSSGELWNCGVLCLSFGSLKKDRFDALFNSEKAKKIREQTKSCKCTLLCTHYF